MKFFIDTANLEEIRNAFNLGVLDGVTTNPSLIAREGINGREAFKDHIRKICEVAAGPVSAECVAEELDGMLAEARELSAISENVVVKVPMTTTGLRAVKILSGEGINTNVTLVFSALQALLAAKAGATYISPFVGRLDDISQNGMSLVGDILEIFSNYLFETEVIVASIRHPVHVLEAARLGADIATIPFKVIEQLARHPLTDKGMEMFSQDWKKVEK